MAGVTYILKLRDQARAVAKKFQKTLQQTTASAQKTADAIDLIGVAAAGIAIGGLFKMGAELEQTNLLFNTLTGSVEKGTKLFEDLTQFANTTPFSNQALNKNATTLLSFGQETESVVDTLRMLGDIAAGDQNKLQSLTLAFAQSQSAGRLMGQDLLQMINVGFNPLQIISEQTGLSMAVLKKRMEAGAISSELVTKAFKIATSEGGRFHNLTNDMATTMAGKWSTALGKSKFLVAELGLSMKGLFVPFLDGIANAVDALSKHRETVFPVIQALTIFTGVLIGIVLGIKAWIVVQTIINTLLIANPIGAIIVAIAALVAIIIVAWQKSDKFRQIVGGVWEVIKLLGKTIWNIYKAVFTPWIEAFKFLIDLAKKLGKALKEKFFSAIGGGEGKLAKFIKFIKEGLIGSFKALVSALGNVGRAIKAFFKGDFEEAGKFAKEAGKNLIGRGEIDIQFAKNAGKKIAEAYRDGASKVKSIIKPELATTAGGIAGGGGLISLGSDVKKLQAEGVVSGGIKTFNININSLTGINTVSTNNITEGAEAAGRAVQNVLFKALADVKNA